MKENLLKLSGAILLASVLAGCGSSSVTNVVDKGEDVIDPKPKPVVPAKCTVSIPKQINIGDTFKVTVKNSNGSSLTPVMTIMQGDKKVDKVDTTKIGEYKVTATGAKSECTVTKTETVKVIKKPVEANGLLDEKGNVDFF